MSKTLKFQPGDNTTMLTPIECRKILREILAERARQIDAQTSDRDFGLLPENRLELVEISAAALRMIEEIDRTGGGKGT